MSIVSATAANTHLDGTIQLPDGRTIPVVVTLDLAQVEQHEIEATDPLLLRAVEAFGKTDKALDWLNSANRERAGPGNVFAQEAAQATITTIIVGNDIVLA